MDTDLWTLDLDELRADPDFTGIEAERAEGYGLVGTTAGEGEPALILQGHIDVVPTGDLAKWDGDPFSGAIRDGAVHGRGACDMKAGVAVNIAVARASHASGLRFERRLVSAIEAFWPIHSALRVLESRRNAHPDPLFAGNPLPYGISVGTITAGDWASSVPDSLVAHGRYNIALNEDPAARPAASSRTLSRRPARRIPGCAIIRPSSPGRVASSAPAGSPERTRSSPRSPTRRMP